ncbi:hypothetical protein MKY98_12835 [Paenibacillus sp. FSL M8-0228]|uniref:hypothetical protein n=1 Tax=Paenibacillus TaxID=44249 RepID=UPI00083E217E|nr:MULTISPECIES: hypothetical protein [Paenibacillus]MBO3287183.1 hypothetical protein [Paenibacillus polymyxa]MBP1312410.1 hypothetical protein [Paenibacillus sp. 1182]ODB55481.1 hypothetical protein A7311_19135 [Paenibacillus polymyxa]
MLLNYCHDYIMFFDWLVSENFTKESMIDEVGFNAQRVLMEYMKIAFADINWVETMVDDEDEGLTGDETEALSIQ